jgi:hypothetical protein
MIPDDLKIKINEAWDAPSWKKAALDFHAKRNGRVPEVEIEPARLRRLRRLRNNNVTLERAHAEFAGKPTDRAATSTVEALAYQLRGGVAALREPPALRRLSELNEAQMREIADRLTKRTPPWEPADIAKFIEMWKKCHG